MSAVQFNLLPEAKAEANKQQHSRVMLQFGLIAAAAVTFGIFVILLLSVGVIQKKQVNDAGKQLDAASAKLAAVPDISNIVTIQSQLQSLATLHQEKHIPSRLFTFLPQVTPSNVSVTRLKLDLKQGTLSLSGNTDTQQSVNSFVDTLKATTFKVTEQGGSTRAFPSVVESNFGITATSVTYSIDMQIDAKLFANNLRDAQGKLVEPKLTVPKAAGQGSQGSQNTIFKTSGQAQ